MKRLSGFIVLSAWVLGLSLQATAGGIVPREAAGTGFTYQGRLTEGGVPVTGTYDFRFVLYDAETGGSPVGSTIEMGDVSVEDGLVTVTLDFGDVVDASALWLEVALRPAGAATYTVLVPRQRLRPGTQGLWSAKAGLAEEADHAASADQATQLGGHPASFFLNTSASTQTKNGELRLYSSGDYGIEASGYTAGGYFSNPPGTGVASLGVGNAGIFGSGSSVGGHFKAGTNPGEAWVGYGDMGIKAQGSTQGGYFLNTGTNARAWAATTDTGIKATGSYAGGDFSDAEGTGHAWAGHDDVGIVAQGSTVGGHFVDTDDSSQAWAGYGDKGLVAQGAGCGGRFVDTDDLSNAWVAYGKTGITAYGPEYGGYFKDDYALTLSEAWAGSLGYGLEGKGVWGGGLFWDTDDGSWAYVAYGNRKVRGTGTVNFVQNHPDDPDRVIEYTAPEGDEVAVYTRGSARLSGGEAKVTLGPTFRWVTDPDLGLTVYVTPRERGCTLYVPKVSTDTLVVRSTEGSDCAFDYMVWGLRIGFEDVSVVQPKGIEAYIPSMRSQRELVATHPELAAYTARNRYLEQGRLMGMRESPDMSRAKALVAAIHEFDPAVDTLGPAHVAPPGEVQRSDRARVGSPDQTPADHAAERIARGVSMAPPMGSAGRDPGRDLIAHSFRSSLGRLATRVAVASPVEAGDVLAIDPDHRGLLKRAAAAGDPTVVGIVVETAGVTLGEGEVGEGAAHALLASPGTIVSCHVDAGYGAIVPGDLLVASPTPGYAMRAADPLPGSVVGKALEPAAEGQGTIKVLVMLR